jgi:hypothetical protein
MRPLVHLKCVEDKPDDIRVGEELPLLLLKSRPHDPLKEGAEHIVLELVFDEGAAFESFHDVRDYTAPH